MDKYTDSAFDNGKHTAENYNRWLSRDDSVSLLNDANLIGGRTAIEKTSRIQELRAQIERELREEYERKLREQEAVLRKKIEKELREEFEKAKEEEERRKREIETAKKAAEKKEEEQKAAKNSERTINLEDFVIEGGVLKKYKGRGGDVAIPRSVTSIGNNAFNGYGSLISVTIPDSVTSIGDYAFGACSKLSSVTLPSTLTKIGNDAFDGCESLTSITLPSTLTKIGQWAFRGSGLTNITLPSSVKNIGAHAFSGCKKLEGITIPDFVTNIANGAFCGCHSLAYLSVDKNNKTYHSSGNCIIDTVNKAIIVGCKNSVIPSDGSVRSIGASAFFGCGKLTSITIPDSVISIGDEAFYWCDSLATITYKGTKAKWNAISKGTGWNSSTGNYTIFCTDGTISK